MKTTKIILAAMALISIATSCCKDNNSPEPEATKTALQVSAATIIGATGQSAGTRAIDAAWEAGDSIGIVMLQAGTATPVDGKTACKYTTATTSGIFLPADEANTAYFPQDGSKTDVVAFYPHKTIATDLLVPVSTADQSKLSQIDLMTANFAKDMNAKQPKVSLNFRHRLAKLVINIDKKSEVGSVDLTGATVAITGTATTAKWNLMSEELTDKANVAPIAVPATTTRDAVRATAIVMPTPAGQGAEIAVTTASGTTYRAQFQPTTALEPGTVNTLSIHLGAAVSATLDVTITDWITGATEERQTIYLDITPGSGQGTYTPQTGDQLNLATVAPAQSATYTYTADAKWNSPAPLYWDNFDAGATLTFNALLTPAAQPAAADAARGAVADYLNGQLTNVTFGSPLAFTMKHSMAQVSVTLATGEGFTADDLAAATVSLAALKPLKSIATDGTVALEATAATTPLPTTKATDGTYTARIAPQTIAANAPMVVISLTVAGNAHTYTLKAPAAGYAYDAATNNRIAITLAKTPAGSISITVTDWTDKTPITGTPELD